jgi:ATP-dependent Clp protease ATP-binding subunit ClpA
VVLDFSDYVVIATSNAGNREVDSAAARAGVAKSQAQRKALYLECLKASFPPELLGRFTDLLVFDFLSLPELQAIARHYGKLQLDRFAEICHTRGQPVPEMAVEDAFYERLASVCDAVLGARNLRGIVERAFKHTWLEQYAGRETKPTRVEFRAADIADDAELS